MSIEAKVIAKSVSVKGKVITTFQLRYPRFIHAEFMTHRMFSRNASSSRAIPVAKIIEQIRNEPAMPIHWGANQAGMQAHAELEGFLRNDCVQAWRDAARQAANIAEYMVERGLHKQVANRILEPFAHISVIVTATEWANFFELRDHPDAQPEIRALAQEMLKADHFYNHASLVGTRVLQSPGSDYLDARCWHLPYITEAERNSLADRADMLCAMSAARCARVSYLTHDGQEPDEGKDLALFQRLVGSAPLHASPIEHQACGSNNPYRQSRNFRGVVQFRELYELKLLSSFDFSTAN
ncbi:Thymidylate synthase ThyX [compost metagenome]